MIFYAFIGSISLNLIVFVLLAYLWQKQRRISKSILTLGAAAAEGRLPFIINQSHEQLNKLTADLEQLNHYYGKLFRLSNNTLQNVGLIRYDAFPEMGGNLSFSIALLNNQKDGLVFTNINGRTEHRLYVKQISAGVSKDHPLTDEENNAIEQANKSSRKLFEEGKKVAKVKNG